MELCSAEQSSSAVPADVDGWDPTLGKWANYQEEILSLSTSREVEVGNFPKVVGQLNTKHLEFDSKFASYSCLSLRSERYVPAEDFDDSRPS
ncbi:uncharacterized protein PHALS_14251 [Plasmopara halstedii]|uniref:Uncharacterized protein n=1 Tax=Plasmopara halstedii TaxID=4781 RepID=A0A0P1AR27_PLAHL|nr:uncharacterized protein PHALS_14251 [Plasmopara halstedii]CEG43976.1 hypothetical protein PHALS_14251 [Plasmopara halstedii]|eukprot:XP_024580345.1 hypothetical protein PHALS_14251 [Plasmopara halstedii]